MKSRIDAVIRTCAGNVVAAASLLCGSAALAQPAPFPSEDVAVALDSGWVSGSAVRDDRAGDALVVFSAVLEVEDATWLRLQFDQLTLAGSREEGNAAILLITSLKDDAYQRLDHISAAQWDGLSAFFNGGALRLEIVAHPGAGDSRVVVSTVTAGLPEPVNEGGIASICFGVDERQLSNDPRDARTSNGCTAFLFNNNHYCMLTAGHCAGNATSVEFNVPLSNSNGTINFAHPNDQYAVDPASKQIQNNPCGNDWAQFGVFPNSNTGLTVLQAQGSTYQLAATTPPPQNQLIRIRGYGTTSSPVSPTWNKVQKEHSGPYIILNGTLLRHQADTTGGNSGSAVYEHNSGLVIGIHTCAGCHASGGSNQATAIHQSSLQNALASPQGVCLWSPPDLTCPGDFDGDDVVGVSDLLILLSKWGICLGCNEDLTGDNRVHVGDLLALLALWGPCP